MPKFEQPMAPPPEQPGEEEIMEQPAVSTEVREIKIKGKKKERPEEAAEKKPEKKKERPSRKTKKSSFIEISEDKSEVAEVSSGPEPEQEPRRPYSKKEWLEIAKTLKEQAEIQREKEKIEEQEEIIELSEYMVVKREKPERTIVNLYKQIREARRELAESKMEYKLQGGDFEKCPRNQKTKEDYEELQRQLFEIWTAKAEKRWGRDSEKFVEFKKSLIFKGFIGREFDRLKKAEYDARSNKEKSRFRQLYEKVVRNYAKLPMGARWGIAAGLGAAVAFGTGAVAASALLGYAGFRYGRAALGSLSAVGAGSIIDGVKKIWLEKYGKEAREEKIGLVIEQEAKNFNTAESFSYFLATQSAKRNEELAKLNRRLKQWKVGKMAAMIGAGGGIAFWAGSIDAFTNETGVSRAIQERLGIEEGKPPVIRPEEVPPVKAGPGVSEPASIPGQFIETAKPGDSVWRLAERHLEEHGYFKGLTGSPEEIAAKKTYLIDWVKDRIAENPEKFGLTDPDKLAVDQKIDFGEILIEDEKTFKISEAFLREVESAEKLSASELAHINNNNELISQWVKNHPGERLTSDKVAEILGGKRLEILTSEEELMSWKDYTKAVPIEREKIDLESWEDYTTKTPPLSDQELMELRDYYDQKSQEYDYLGDREAAETAEALKDFYADRLRIYNDVMEILAPTNLRPAEYLAIKNVSVGKFLEETAGGWEKWRSDEAITIDLPHDGVYGASEYGRQLKLAEFIKNTNPTEFDKSLTIEEYLKQFIKKE